MRLPGRLAAAIEVLANIEARHRPVSEALKDWGNANRFAGAGDRAAIGNIVYDALRKRASHAFAMGSDAPRALVLSVAVRDWGESLEALAAASAGDRFAPPSVSDVETARLAAPDPLEGAPDWVRANVPEWTMASLQESFGADWLAECEALTGRPPLDLRVNTLKSNRERVLKSLDRFTPLATDISPIGVRIPAGPRDARTPNVTTDEGYLKGWFEVQDQGSQIAALLASAKPGEQVLDLCAGAGGKTLAMAAAMNNHGQLFAFDSDRNRLAPIYDRLKRNGARNVQVRAPLPGALDDLVGKMDRVVIDAPCTGSGTWRRRPDAKWKLTREQLASRLVEQRAILAEGMRYLKPAGALIYITCSILYEENDGQITEFLKENPDFAALQGMAIWQATFGSTRPSPRITPAGGVILSPHSTGTDGFYVGVISRPA
jgi:16S rRNA (cytosine967-C5)-methyltransferase